jgi:hypothetical protein
LQETQYSKNFDADGPRHYNTHMGLRPSLTRVSLFCSIFAFLLLSKFLFFPSSLVAQTVEIGSVRLIAGSETDFVISGNDNFQFYMFALKDPHRLVIDCRPARLAMRVPANLMEPHPNVIRIRADQMQKHVVRIVFDLKHQAKYSALMNGNDLKVRIVDKTNAQQAENPSPQHKPAPVGKSDSDIELSVSTQDGQKPGKVSDEPEIKKSKSPVKMQGYLVDKFRRNVGRGQDSQPDMTNSYALSLKYRDKNKNSTFKIDYDVIGHEYMEPFVDDYMSHNVKIGYEWRWGSNWSVKAVGRAELNPYYGDQYGFRPEVTYQFNPRSSFSFYGGHRTKVFNDYRDRIDQDRYLGMKYITKIGDQTLELRYQRNFNDSEKVRYDYVNTRYSVGYHVPWNKRARTLFRLEYSPREYEARMIRVEPEDLEFGTLRQDEGWTFAIVSRFRLTNTFDIVPRYVIQDRYSNDPLIDELTLHVPSISLRGRW